MDDAEKYERMREKALSSWSPVDYFLACESLGVPPDNEDLYIHGALEHQRQERTSGLEKIHPEKEVMRNIPKTEDPERAYWEGVAWAALSRFPELQAGEHVTSSELKKRLGKIRKTGYAVKPHSGMKQKELWNYIMKIRAEVYRQAENHCPEVLEKIRAFNENSRACRDY